MVEKIEICLSETQMEVLKELSEHHIHYHQMTPREIIREWVNSEIAKHAR